MRRNAEPIDWTQIRFEMELSFSLDSPELQTYRDRLRKRFEQFQRGADKGGGKLIKSANDGLEFRRTLRDGIAVDRMTIHEGSSFWPNAAETKETAAVELLREWTVEITFAKDPAMTDDGLTFSVRRKLNDPLALNEFSASFGPKQSWLRSSSPASEAIADGFKTFSFRMIASR